MISEAPNGWCETTSDLHQSFHDSLALVDPDVDLDSVLNANSLGHAMTMLCTCIPGNV